MHMRVRANLTGEEYAKLIAFLQRWHDVPSPSPPVDGPPKRFNFSQPIPELREEQQAKERAAEAPAAADALGTALPAHAPTSRPRSLERSRRPSIRGRTAPCSFHGLAGGRFNSRNCFSTSSHCCSTRGSGSRNSWSPLFLSIRR